MNAEVFIIGLQSNFVSTPELETVLRLVSNLSSDLNVNIADDGISQKVTVNKGVSMKEAVVPPRRVKLMPYRTFPEIAQPESEFVLRIKGETGAAPGVALFEADGGVWKNEAMIGIKNYLENLIAKIPILA
jgi:hypothetical protein